MKLSIIEEKSKGFAVRVVKLYRYLTMTANEREHVLSKQLLRSGTSIGANVKEALRGQSRADFHSKMNIALKEACETEYWIELLKDTDYISEEQFLSLQGDYKEIIKILMSITKSTAPMAEDKY